MSATSDLVAALRRATEAEKKLTQIEAILDNTENTVRLTDERWQSEHDSLYAILDRKS